MWGEVQIIEEDAPLKTPRDAFAQLATSSSFRPHTSLPLTSLDVSPSEQQDHMDSDVNCDASSSKSIASDHSLVGTQICRSSYTKQPCQASLSFWPRWAYEMYDSYALARRAAGR